MSVIELKTQIERKAEEEATKIIENAKQEAERMLSQSSTRMNALRDEQTEALMRMLDTEERAELAVSRMDMKGELLQLRSSWADRVFEETSKRMVEMSQKSGLEYREFLGKLILEGISKIKGNKFIVEANSRDSEAIKKELKTILERGAKIKNQKIELQVKTSSTISSGGVVVSTEDMTQYFNNTLEARLSQARETLSGEIHKIVFKTGV